MSLPDLDAAIERMTAYCTYCPKMCRFSCPTAGAESRETVTPWGMMRLLEMAKDGSVTLDSDVADAFFHCTGCRRCQTFCNHDNDVPRALWEARQWVVDSGFLPEAYQGLVEEFAQSDTPYGTPDEPIDTEPFDPGSPIAYWPDCSTVTDHPRLVGAVGRLMERIFDHPVRLVESDDFDHPPCCGFPLTGAGIEDGTSCRDNRWPALDGVETIWTDCAALAAWNRPDSSWPLDDIDKGPTVDHLFVLLADRLGDIPPDEPLEVDDGLLHQSCFVERQLDGGDDVDRILDHISEQPPEKMAYADDESPCCGGRCHYKVLEPEASEEASKTVTESLDRHDGADRLVTTSSMCRQAMDEADPQRSITSLLELICRAYGLLEL